MSDKVRSSFLSLAVIAVLIFSAMNPTNVRADEGTPPDPPPTETSSGCAASNDCPSEEAGTAEPPAGPTEVSASDQPTSEPEPVSTATEVPVETTSVPDETAVETGSEEQASGEESPLPQPTEEAAPVAEEAAPAPESTILVEVPDDTTVTVLNAEGQAEPLVTQDAADAIAELDPIWCPAGQAPTPGANGCTPSFNSFKALLTFLSGNVDYQGAGTIYIQEGVYISGGANDLNDYDLSNISNSDLTVTGGWNPTTGAVNPGSTSQFRIPLRIGTSANPWGGSLTINNLTIDKSDGTSLVLYSQGDITLSNVNITNAHNNGAGAELNAGGNVSIDNSNFIRNKQAGAIIKAAGTVGISNSSFSNPTSGRQQIIGLDIMSGGSVTLASVTANGNREVGANINSGNQVVIADSFFSGNKAMKGSGPSRTFWGYGLQVTTPNSILMANVEANDNFLWGASLQTDGNIAITDSIFNANTTADPHFIDDTGLIITSGGDVTLNNVEANDNRLIGATIKATGDVTIDNSRFSNNRGVTLSANGTPVFQGYGLQVITQGRIILNFVNASNNTLFGAHLESGESVDVIQSNFDNQTSGSPVDQTGRGLEIISAGNVFLSFVSVSNNQTFGADIQAGEDVFLSIVTATGNGTNGVNVDTSCDTVYQIEGNYSTNGGYGLSLTNSALDQTAPVMGNNGLGDISQDPGACVFPPAVIPGNNNNGGTPNTPVAQPVSSQQQPAIFSSGPNNAFASSFRTTRAATGNGTFNGAGATTLNDFLAIAKISTGSNIHLGLFAGTYAYIYSSSGIQIVVFLPASNSLVMGE